VTYHDSCYLGSANDVYEAPRSVLAALDIDLAEMGRSKKTGMCCGAGGAQMFKEEENGQERINTNRTKEALDTGAEIIVANCPFCTTMLEDGVKSFEKQNEVKVLDIVELLKFVHLVKKNLNLVVFVVYLRHPMRILLVICCIFLSNFVYTQTKLEV
jgi:heterodisulfide reductase subunit D